MKKPEILAPAGNYECLIAAIEAGADAVYIGGKLFGARYFASNFTSDEIVKSVEYAHSYGVKIYVTVNTLIYENEVDEFIDYIDFLYKNNVDAIIIQDIGMMDLVRQLYPDFEMHASTQMHIHNLEGVKLVEKLGLKRTVLARETPIELIKEIKDSTNIELEIFVHGALCVSYSGQCLMSSLIGGRSGNRGTCAGSCRQKYDVLDINKNKINKYSYNLSTKDLNTLENIDKLIKIGVDSLKIEGRMKSPSYVYLVTKLYREAVDSYISSNKINIDYDNLKNLMKTFNRNYTKGFLFHEVNKNFINPVRPNHLGVEIGRVIKVDKNRINIKLTDDLNINDGIRFIGKIDEGMTVTKMKVLNKDVTSAYSNDIVTVFFDKKVEKNSIVVKTTDYILNKHIENNLKKLQRKVKISGNIIIKKNKPMKLNITDGIRKISVDGNINIEEALKISTLEEEVISRLSKTGDTIFEFDKINVEMDKNVFIPIKELNELKRNSLNLLYQERIKNNRNLKLNNIYSRNVIEYPSTNEKSLYISNDLKINNRILKYDRIYVDYNDTSYDNYIKKLPRVMEKHLNYNEHLLVSELGSVNKYTNIDTDFSLNVVNSYSIALLNSLGVQRITLSYELTYEQISDIIKNYIKRYNKKPNLAVIVYAKEELMVSKFNLLDYYNLKNSGYLKDRFNNLYKIIIRNDFMYIYNYKPRNINPKIYFDLGINEVRYNIVDEEDLNFI